MPAETGSNRDAPGARQLLRPSQVGWMAAAGVLPAIAAGLAVLATLGMALPEADRFDARLRADRAPVALPLPEFLNVEKVLVREDQHVAKGTPLFQLDQALGLDVVTELERTITQKQMERECLLAWPVDPFAARRVASLEPDRSALAQTTPYKPGSVLSEAAAACDLRRSEITSELLHVTGVEANLKRRLTLLDQKVHLLRGENAKENAAGAAYEALSVALAHNLLQAELISARAELYTARNRVKRQLLAEARDKAQSLGALRMQVARLKRHLSDPIVRAPFAGIVRRVRIQNRQTGLTEPHPAVELFPDEGNFVVNFDISDTRVWRIEEGRAVEVHLAWPGHAPSPLLGHVVSATPSPAPGLATVTVKLDPVSTRSLASGKAGLGLHGPETSARVVVALNPVKAAGRMTGALQNSLGASPFLEHVVEMLTPVPAAPPDGHFTDNSQARSTPLNPAAGNRILPPPPITMAPAKLDRGDLDPTDEVPVGGPAGERIEMSVLPALVRLDD